MTLISNLIGHQIKPILIRFELVEEFANETPDIIFSRDIENLIELKL